MFALFRAFNSYTLKLILAGAAIGRLRASGCDCMDGEFWGEALAAACRRPVRRSRPEFVQPDAIGRANPRVLCRGGARWPTTTYHPTLICLRCIEFGVLLRLLAGQTFGCFLSGSESNCWIGTIWQMERSHGRPKGLGAWSITRNQCRKDGEIFDRRFSILRRAFWGAGGYAS